MGLFFNFNFQSGLKFHSEVVIPYDNTRKPALYQGLVVGLFTIGLFEKLFLEALQFFVDPISGILLSASDHLCDVLLELCLVG